MLLLLIWVFIVFDVSVSAGCKHPTDTELIKLISSKISIKIIEWEPAKHLSICQTSGISFHNYHIKGIFRGKNETSEILVKTIYDKNKCQLNIINIRDINTENVKKISKNKCTPPSDDLILQKLSQQMKITILKWKRTTTTPSARHPNYYNYNILAEYENEPTPVHLFVVSSFNTKTCVINIEKLQKTCPIPSDQEIVEDIAEKLEVIVMKWKVITNRHQNKPQLPLKQSYHTYKLKLNSENSSPIIIVTTILDQISCTLVIKTIQDLNVKSIPTSQQSMCAEPTDNLIIKDIGETFNIVILDWKPIVTPLRDMKRKMYKNYKIKFLTRDTEIKGIMIVNTVFDRMICKLTIRQQKIEQAEETKKCEIPTPEQFIQMIGNYLNAKILRWKEMLNSVPKSDKLFYKFKVLAKFHDDNIIKELITNIVFDTLNCRTKLTTVKMLKRSLSVCPLPTEQEIIRDIENQLDIIIVAWRPAVFQTTIHPEGIKYQSFIIVGKPSDERVFRNLLVTVQLNEADCRLQIQQVTEPSDERTIQLGQSISLKSPSLNFHDFHPISQIENESDF